jgi:hypothetical protein
VIVNNQHATSRIYGECTTGKFFSSAYRRFFLWETHQEGLVGRACKTDGISMLYKVFLFYFIFFTFLGLWSVARTLLGVSIPYFFIRCWFVAVVVGRKMLMFTTV